MILRHDVIQYRTAFYAACCTVDTKEKVLRVGYLFVDMLQSDTITVQSHTQETYKIRIPETMLKLASSQQFNYEFEIVD